MPLPCPRAFERPTEYHQRLAITLPFERFADYVWRQREIEQDARNAGRASRWGMGG